MENIEEVKVEETKKVLLSEVLDNIGKDVLLSYTSVEKLTGGKKNEQQGRITKVTEGLTVVIVGKGDYEKAKKEAGDPEFVAQPRKWGVRNNDGLIEHNGELYVEFMVKHKGTSTYLLDDKPIEKDKIIGLSSTTVDTEKNPIILRSVKLKNITNISEITGN